MGAIARRPRARPARPEYQRRGRSRHRCSPGSCAGLRRQSRCLSSRGKPLTHLVLASGRSAREKLVQVLALLPIWSRPVLSTWLKAMTAPGDSAAGLGHASPCRRQSLRQYKGAVCIDVDGGCHRADLPIARSCSPFHAGVRPLLDLGAVQEDFISLIAIVEVLCVSSWVYHFTRVRVLSAYESV